MNFSVFFVFLLPLAANARGTGSTSIIDGLLMLIIFGFFAYSIVKDSPRKKFVTSSILITTFLLLFFNFISPLIGTFLVIAAPFIGFAADSQNSKSNSSSALDSNITTSTFNTTDSFTEPHKKFNELIDESDLSALFNKFIKEELEGKNYKSEIWNKCSNFSNSNSTIQRRLYKSIRRKEMYSAVSTLREKYFDSSIDLRGHIKKTLFESNYALSDNEFLEEIHKTLSSTFVGSESDIEPTANLKSTTVKSQKLEFTTYLVNGVPHTYVDGKLKKVEN